MDILEITLPRCIATASLDRTIRFYNIEERHQITVLKGHETGIRHMSYISGFGGFLVSVGYELSVYVWSPETAVNRPLIGKLEGNSEPVVDA
jgi:WD40 repeat protein